MLRKDFFLCEVIGGEGGSFISPVRVKRPAYYWEKGVLNSCSRNHHKKDVCFSAIDKEKNVVWERKCREGKRDTKKKNVKGEILWERALNPRKTSETFGLCSGDHLADGRGKRGSRVK